MRGSITPPKTSLGVTRVLRLVFERPTGERVERREPADAAEATVDATDRRPIDLDFVAYADDSLLAGLIRLDADRLTDLINDADELELVDVVAQSIVSGAVTTHERLTLARSDILAVRAGAPRGRVARRLATRRHPVVLGVGRYDVVGRLHVPPDTSAGVSFASRRGPMVPLTDASIHYLLAGKQRSDVPPVLLVNRERMDWLRILDDEERSTAARPTAAREKGARSRSGSAGPGERPGVEVAAAAE
jgi:hypothetical protein